MTLPRDRLDELFVRYWDNALTDAEAAELAALLAADPVAREQFQILSAQAVTAAELPAFTPAVPESKPQPRPAPAARLSRRQAFRLAGGLAAGLGAVALGRWAWKEWSGDRVTVIALQGTVTVRTAEGRSIPAQGTVPTGATVSTQGHTSTAVLQYADGSTVTMIGDAAVTVHENGRRLRLHEGTASADIRQRDDRDNRVTMTTALVTLADLSDATLTLGQGRRSTEVEVHQGSVNVSAPSGEPMAVVHEGELFTVGSNGNRVQEPTPATPAEFAWKLDRDLPEGWAVGHREFPADGPVVCCDRWPDPYYDRRMMYQIRSDHQWTRGHFRLVEKSVVHVRYRAKLASPDGQVCFCVRTPQSSCSDTGMVEYNGGFVATEGKWEWLHVPAVEMLPNRHAPKFKAPWVGFLVIFNTFEKDIGLEVAEFRVTPPKLA